MILFDQRLLAQGRGLKPVARPAMVSRLKVFNHYSESVLFKSA